MIASRGLRTLLRVSAALVLVVIYVPLGLVILDSFNVDKTFTWPPRGLTLHWWKVAAHSTGARSALLTSVEVAADGARQTSDAIGRVCIPRRASTPSSAR